MSNEEILKHKIEHHLAKEHSIKEGMHLNEDELILCCLALKLQTIDNELMGILLE